MSVALMVVTDGRGYLDRTMASARECLPAFDHEIVVDDSDHRLGFGGAIREGWRRVLETDASHVFHLEDDFTFNRPVPLADLRAVLHAHPHLAQMALLRQPWNEQEKAAGGIVQMHPGDYRLVKWGDSEWLEHRRNFTTNPSLYPRWVCSHGWPQGRESEGRFGIGLLQQHPDLCFAYWGDGSEWVTHIGEVRTGRGY